MKKLLAVLLVLSTFLVSSCGHMSHAEKRSTTIGAGIGAVTLGVATASVFGAAVGAGVGGFVGNQLWWYRAVEPPPPEPNYMH